MSGVSIHLQATASAADPSRNGRLYGRMFGFDARSVVAAWLLGWLCWLFGVLLEGPRLEMPGVGGLVLNTLLRSNKISKL